MDTKSPIKSLVSLARANARKANQFVQFGGQETEVAFFRGQAHAYIVAARILKESGE